MTGGGDFSGPASTLAPVVQSPRTSRLRRVILAGALIVAASLAYLHSSSGMLNGSRLPSADAGLMLHAEPMQLPDIAFEDSEGRPASLSGLRGKLVLLNVWATWCAPCREEMPTLSRLQARLGSPNFEVVTLSVDRDGLATVKSFLAGIGIQNLRILLDRNSSSMVDTGVLGVPISNSMGSLGVYGLPTTLLIGRDGRELGRLVGPAQWDTPGTIVFIERLLSNAGAPS